MSWSRLAFALFTTPVHTDLDCLSLLFSTAPHATLRHAMDPSLRGGTSPTARPTTTMRPTTRSATALASSMAAGGRVPDPQEPESLSTHAHSRPSAGPGAETPSATSDKRSLLPPTSLVPGVPTQRSAPPTTTWDTNMRQGPSAPRANSLSALATYTREPTAPSLFGDAVAAARTGALAASQALNRFGAAPARTNQETAPLR